MLQIGPLQVTNIQLPRQCVFLKRYYAVHRLFPFFYETVYCGLCPAHWPQLLDICISLGLLRRIPGVEAVCPASEVLLGMVRSIATFCRSRNRLKVATYRHCVQQRSTLYRKSPQALPGALGVRRGMHVVNKRYVLSTTVDALQKVERQWINGVLSVKNGIQSAMRPW